MLFIFHKRIKCPCPPVWPPEVKKCLVTPGGQTGGHRWMVILWKMISIKFLIFWAYSRPSTSKLTFFKDWPFDHLWPLKKVRRNSTIFLKIGTHVLGTKRLHPCKFYQNPTGGHFPNKVCEILRRTRGSTLLQLFSRNCEIENVFSKTRNFPK